MPVSKQCPRCHTVQIVASMLVCSRCDQELTEDPAMKRDLERLDLWLRFESEYPEQAA